MVNHCVRELTEMYRSLQNKFGAKASEQLMALNRDALQKGVAIGRQYRRSRQRKEPL